MNLSVDDPRIAASGLPMTQEANLATFTLPPAADRPNDAPQIVKVVVANGELRFFTERSSAQKRLLSTLLATIVPND